MNRQFVTYTGMGVALAVLSLGTVGWAMSVAQPASVQTSAASDESVAAPAPVATVIPADNVINGSAAAVANSAGLSADASAPQGNQIKICDAEVKGWVRSDSIRLNDSGVGVSVQIAAWRAGAAAAAFDDLERGAAGCAQVSSDQQSDEFRAALSSGDGQWAAGVRRVGDVLIAVSASSGGADPAQWVDKVLAEGQKALKPRLAQICVDPTSVRRNDLVGRDPYSGKYVGFLVASPRKLQDQPVFTKAEIAAVKARQPQSTWSGPAAVADPQLAPIKVAPGSPPAPVGADPATAPRGSAPQIYDLQKFVPPSSPEPSRGDDALKEPSAPDVGDGVSVAMVPTVDTSGPGCGWDFAGTVNPVTTKESLEASARKAVIAALLKDTQAQGQRMVNALNWPSEYQVWVTKASIAASWDDYRSQLESAKYRLSNAKEKYQSSLDLWRQGTLAPEPTASPVPSGAPSGTPTPSQSTNAAGGAR